MRRGTWRPAMGSVVMIAITLVFLYPFFWMLVGSFKSNREIFDTSVVLPKTWSWEYFRMLFSNEHLDFGRALGNSLLLGVLQCVGATGFAASAGFVLGTHRFRLRPALRLLGIASILVPMQVLALPLFVWMNRIGLFDSIVGLAFVGMANGIGLLYFERVFRQVPRELLEVGRMEGASEARIFRQLLPLAWPHVIAFGFVVFALSWQTGLLSMLLLHSDEQRTLIMLLSAQFGSGLRPPLAVLMAGSTLALLVMFLVFASVFPFMRSALRDFLS